MSVSGYRAGVWGRCWLGLRGEEKQDRCGWVGLGEVGRDTKSRHLRYQCLEESHDREGTSRTSNILDFWLELRRRSPLCELRPQEGERLGGAEKAVFTWRSSCWSYEVGLKPRREAWLKQQRRLCRRSRWGFKTSERAQRAIIYTLGTQQ